MNRTIDKQSGDITDIYSPYYKTCENGDAKPVLPLIEFYKDEEDKLSVTFKYHLFVYPDGDTLKEVSKVPAPSPDGERSYESKTRNQGHQEES